MMKNLPTLVASIALVIAGSVSAHGYTSGDLAIAHPYALATPPGATTGGAYVKEIDNNGKTADALIGASSPMADRVEIHAMTMDGDVMRMRPVKAIAIEPGRAITMQPGNGYHLMLVGIHQPLAIGAQVPLTLQFERAGKVDVMLTVQERGMPDMHHMSQ